MRGSRAVDGSQQIPFQVSALHFGKEEGSQGCGWVSAGPNGSQWIPSQVSALCLGKKVDSRCLALMASYLWDPPEGPWDTCAFFQVWGGSQRDLGGSRRGFRGIWGNPEGIWGSQKVPEGC